jgi:hypothetical protein
MKDWKVKQVLYEGGDQWEGESIKEMVKKREYGGSISYSCMKIEQ